CTRREIAAGWSLDVW
nr:immunoglobulin heavy chain junction region [Macaca mulatta]